MAYAMMGLAALAGGIIQPLTGFGAAVIMMVAASAFYDMTIAPTIVALICMAQSGTMTWMYRKHIDVKQIALPIGLYTVCSLVIINLLGNFSADCVQHNYKSPLYTPDAFARSMVRFAPS